jgi:hypothetical protein
MFTRFLIVLATLLTANGVDKAIARYQEGRPEAAGWFALSAIIDALVLISILRTFAKTKGK